MGLLIVSPMPLVIQGSEQSPNSENRVGAAAILPSDVFVRVALVRGELEQIRFVMGRPKNSQPEIDVKGAAPREVYFQALTLFRKANRLCFEHTRDRSDEPKLPTGEIRPTDVYEVVDAALERIRRVKAEIGISKQAKQIAPDRTKQPNDVFRSVVQANRQLNLLLDQRFAPSDVFQQVTRAVGYTSRLLEHFPDATTMPKPPAFEEGKRPGDVYRRLVGCFERIRKIAKKSGLEMIELKTNETRIQVAEPSDVYDMASLAVSELAFLHSHLRQAKKPRKVFYVGRKFPSHVYQRVGILERQLIELEMWVNKNPLWLGKSANSQD